MIKSAANTNPIQETCLGNVEAEKVGKFCGHMVKEMEFRDDLAAMLHSNIIPRRQAAEVEHIISKLFADVELAHSGFEEFIGTSEFQHLPEEDREILQKNGASFATIKAQLEATQARAKLVKEYVPTSGSKLNLTKEIEEITSAVRGIPTEFVEAQKALTADLKKYGLLAIFQRCCQSSLQLQLQTGLISASTASTASTGPAVASSKAPANAPLTTVLARGTRVVRAEEAGLEKAKQREDILRDAKKDAQKEEALAKKLQEKLSELRRDAGESETAAAA